MVDPGNNEQKALQRDLLQQGLLSEAQLKTVSEYQASIGGRVTDIIRKLGFVSEDRLNAFIARREHMHPIDLQGKEVDRTLMARIPRRVIESHCVIPFRQSEDVILLAMSEAMDFQAIEEIQFLTNCKIETALASRSQLLERINQFYAAHPDLDPSESSEEARKRRLEDKLVERVSDPIVAALARALLRSGQLDARVWDEELGR